VLILFIRLPLNRAGLHYFLSPSKSGPGRAEWRILQLSNAPGDCSHGLFSAARLHGERDGFVQEKQFRIAVWGHHYAVPTPKFKNARDPPPALVAADDFPVGGVHCTTSVAHHCAASRSPKNVAERVYAVLQWHF
jgi:hypothetical protein